MKGNMIMLKKSWQAIVILIILLGIEIPEGNFTVYAVDSGSGTALVNGGVSYTGTAGDELHWTRISDDGYKFNSWDVTPPTTLTANATHTATFEEIVAPIDAVDITSPPSPLVACTGSGDETTKLQAVIDYCNTNSKAMVIPSGIIVNASNLVIDYDDFELYGFGTIKRIDNAPDVANDFLVLVVNCDNVNIPILHTDGNVAGNEPSARFSEYKHQFRITNCTDINLGMMYDLNALGDSIYINGCIGATIDTAYSYTYPTSGRNGFAIADASNVYVENILSYHVGVNGMPGGFDIEPNAGDTCNNIHVHYADIITETAGFQVSNNHKVDNTAWMYDIFIDKIKMDRTHGPTGIGDFGGTIQGFNASATRSHINLELVQHNYESHGPAILRCEDLDMDIKCNAYNKQGMYIYESKNMDITGQIDGSLYNSIYINDYTGASTENITINMKLKNPDSAGTGNYGVIRVESGATLDDVIFSGNWSKANTGAFGINNSGTIIDCKLINLDISGFAPNTMIGNSITWPTISNVTGWPEGSVEQFTITLVGDENGTPLVNGVTTLTADEDTALVYTHTDVTTGYEIDTWDVTPPSVLAVDGTYTASYD